MTHPRDFKIAKQLKNCISEFMHTDPEAPQVMIDQVSMLDKKNAQILYRLHYSLIESEDNINMVHEQLLNTIPRARNFIAKQLNLKAIPKLNFSILLDSNA